ncbi:anti-virulence regulator CigR family protein [Halomonas sp. LR5S13]|uniref:anti-virulence regulator CigR family protein n=1 Tax=Halomonas rhizosphaerae TaxID=3043296 RepID=UPI0024A8DA8D|nr:anti-virulence regulator CigR family protein [Halomonas rhizosphaerae]MDI5920316.1 anti-virulence regulator CigR family protein [Halomonas rhizosphaerae]
MKTRFPLYPLVVAGALGLALAASPLLAQPGNGQGNAQGAAPWKEEGQQQRGQKNESQRARESRGQGQGQARGERDRQEYRDRERDEYRDRERDEYRDRERDEYRDRERDEYRDREGYRDEARRPMIDEREVREIFRSRREYLQHEDRDSLPPGIRMNLERGKPLPPGIARNFDERVRRDLPYYEGYEWRRVGTDAVLVDLTDDIIHEVIQDILR